MSIFLGILFFLFLVCPYPAIADEPSAAAARRGGLISAESVTQINAREIESFLVKNLIPRAQIESILSGVRDKSDGALIKYIRLLYYTSDYKGCMVKASGLLALPADICVWNRRMVCYMHGTLFDDKAAPSDINNCSEAGAVASVFVLRGYAAAFPDYTGLGETGGFHPYFHAASCAICCDDFLEAVKSYLNSIKYDGAFLRIADNEIYLAGFSQGAHVMLALQRHLESGGALCGLNVAAAAGISGAYDPSVLLRGWLLRPNPLSGAVMARILGAYNEIYLKGAPSDFLKKPYIEAVNDIVYGGFSLEKISSLPSDLNVLLTEEFINESARKTSYKETPDNGRNFLLMALEENAVHKGWTPRVPVNFYYGGADDIIDCGISRAAYHIFKAQGADVSFIKAEEKAGHAESIVPSCLLAREWFDSRHADKYDHN